MFGRLGIVFFLSALFQSTVYGIVTSDVAGSHVVQVQEQPFGIDMDGVVQLRIGRSLCSGAAIPGVDGYDILTAAHCLDGAARATVIFPNGQRAFSNELFTHPAFNFSFDTGFDVGVVSIRGNLPAAPVYPLFDGSSEVGSQGIQAGYGRSGHGNTGDTIAAGTLRAGLNRIDGLGFPTLDDVPFSHRGSQNLSFDFDNGDTDHDGLDVLFGIEGLGFGDDEVGIAGGDSGGPTFVMVNGQPQLAGVHSFVRRVPSTDINNRLDSSFGELSVDTRVSHQAIRRFIDFATDPNDPRLIGDSDGDGDVDLADMNGAFDNPEDLNGDGSINNNDIDFLVRDVLGTGYGDLNLDRKVETGEIVTFFQNIGMTGARWEDGDFTGDGLINSSDIVRFYQTRPGFDETTSPLSPNAFAAYSEFLGDSSQSVPEPTTLYPVFFAFMATVLLRRKRNVG